MFPLTELLLIVICPAKAPAVAYVPCTTMMFNGPLIEIDPTCVAKP